MATNKNNCPINNKNNKTKKPKKTKKTRKPITKNRKNRKSLKSRKKNQKNLSKEPQIDNSDIVTNKLRKLSSNEEFLKAYYRNKYSNIHAVKRKYKKKLNIQKYSKNK